MREDMLLDAEARVSRPIKYDPVTIYTKTFLLACETHGVSDTLANEYLTRRPFGDMSMLFSAEILSSEDVALIADLDAAALKKKAQEFEFFCKTTSYIDLEPKTIASLLVEM